MSAATAGALLNAEMAVEIEIAVCRALGVRSLWVRQRWLDVLGRERLLELVDERGDGQLVAVLGASWQTPPNAAKVGRP